jgi:hypothetical protein
MKNIIKRKTIIIELLTLLYITFVFTMVGCTFLTPRHKEQIHSVLEKRQAICEFVSLWAEDRPELIPVMHACATDKTLQEISNVYSECTRAK